VVVIGAAGKVPMPIAAPLAVASLGMTGWLRNYREIFVEADSLRIPYPSRDG